MTRLDFDSNTKIISESNSLDALKDAIADLQLCGYDDAKLEAAIQEAKVGAEMHVDAEMGGESEGFRILIEPIDGDSYWLDEKSAD